MPCCAYSLQGTSVLIITTPVTFRPTRRETGGLLGLRSSRLTPALTQEAHTLSRGLGMP